jgi:hypothetical protein
VGVVAKRDFMGNLIWELRVMRLIEREELDFVVVIGFEVENLREDGREGGEDKSNKIHVNYLILDCEGGDDRKDKSNKKTCKLFYKGQSVKRRDLSPGNTKT